MATTPAASGTGPSAGETRPAGTTSVTAASLPVAGLLTSANGALDAYTFIAHGGVFANAQTGNVILLAVGLADARVAQPLAHLWPILAFVLGIVVARALLRPRVAAVLRRPVVVSLVVHTVVLAVIAVLPADAPTALITCSIGFLSAVQLALFRSVGDAAFVTIAMTGNLLRTVDTLREAVHGRRSERHRAAVYLALVGLFACGAALGAVLTAHVGTRAAWFPATLTALAAVQFPLAAERARRRRPDPAAAGG